MRVLITGNMGYLGPVLVRHLRGRSQPVSLTGFDTGLFAHCLTTQDGLPERRLDSQVFGDIRQPPDDLFEGVDAVVHLAAISNDPIGKEYEAVTDEINFEKSSSLAAMAKAQGVRRFVFSSSCSVYGAGGNQPCTEASRLDPLTAYARSKLDLEGGLADLADDHFKVTCLRFATACGMSDRLRLDLVLNDFVASAIAVGRIEILSDGTPWRPLIHVKDMARAIEWGLSRCDGDNFIAINCGANDWNHQVRDLAETVARLIPDTSVSVNQDAAPDRRSYQVDFSAFENLAPDHQPNMTLDAAILDLEAGLRGIGFDDSDFRNSDLIRLNTIAGHRGKGLLDGGLYWLDR